MGVRTPLLSALALGVSGVGFAVVATNPAVAAGEPSPAAQSAVGWLERELSANDYTMVSSTGELGTTDWGLTIDALISIASANRSGEVSDHVVERILTDGSAYLENTHGGCGSANMGAYAKTAYALLLAGQDAALTCDGQPVDLVQELRDSVQSNGRIGSSTNHFGQTLAMLALARTDEGVPASAVDYVTSLQCTDPDSPNYGGLGYGASCASVDGDSAGFMVSGLLAAGLDESDPVIGAFVDWAANNQAADGSFAPSYNTSIGNTNSTGLVASALRQIGTPEALAIAADAETYIEGLQITAENATVESDGPDTGGGLATGWIGAIAYTQSSFNSAVNNGIAQTGTDQWRRAAAQAVLGLDGMAGFSELSLTYTPTDPVDPSDPTDPTDPSDPSTPAVDGWSTGPCAQGEGLTVVVDFGTDSARGLEARCRLGGQINRSQTSRVTALHAVGYPVTADGSGLVTGIDGVTASGGQWWMFSGQLGPGAWGEAYELPAGDLTNWFYGVCLSVDGCVPRADAAYAADPDTDPTVTITGPTTTPYGTAATLHVQVTAAETPTGTVTLTGVGATRSATLTSGSATVALPRTLAVGTHQITAHFDGFDSDVHVVTVTKGSVKKVALAVTKQPTSKRAGTAKVSVKARAGLATATGKVKLTLKKGSTTRVVTAKFRGGSALVGVPKLAAGTWKVTARYVGSPTYAAARSSTLRIKVS